MTSSKHAAVGRQSISEKKVGRPVARIVIGGRILILIFALEIDVAAEIQIKAAVAIIVRRGHSCERALRLGSEPERFRMFPESAVASIEEQQRARKPEGQSDPDDRNSENR